MVKGSRQWVVVVSCGRRWRGSFMGGGSRCGLRRLCPFMGAGARLACDVACHVVVIVAGGGCEWMVMVVGGGGCWRAW